MLDHLPRQVVWVLDDIGGGVGVAGRNTCFFQRLDHFVAAVLHCPLADRGVDQFGMLRPAIVMREARIIGQILAPHQRHQALVDAVAIAGNQYVRAVIAQVGIGGRDAWQCTTGGLADIAEGVVLGYQAFHHGEYRFVQRDVDFLSLAAAVALLQGEQHTDYAVERGQRVTNAHADTHRRLARISGQVS